MSSSLRLPLPGCAQSDSSSLDATSTRVRFFMYVFTAISLISSLVVLRSVSQNETLVHFKLELQINMKPLNVNALKKVCASLLYGCKRAQEGVRTFAI